MWKFILFLLAILVGAPVCNLVQYANSQPSTPVTVALEGDAVRGQDIFQHGFNGAPPCSSCHALVKGAFGLGPVMTGISERAGTRVPGLTAEEYMRQSILEPKAYLVSGYRDIMYPQYSEHLNDQDIADLIAYLITL